jgi:Mg2+ and Co2+ transporter CorA
MLGIVHAHERDAPPNAKEKTHSGRQSSQSNSIYYNSFRSVSPNGTSTTGVGSHACVHCHALNGEQTLMRSFAPPTAGASPIWIDLKEPTEEERAQVTNQCKIHGPSRDELSEIESSSRLFSGDGLV